MAVVGNLAIGMSADSSKFTKDLAKGSTGLKLFEQVANRAKASLEGFGAKVGAGIGVAVGVGMGVATAGVFELVGAGAKLNSVISKSGVIFKDSTGIVLSGAQEMADAYGTVKSEFIGAAASFGAVFKGVGKSEKESAELGVQLAKLGMDMASLDGVMNEDAFTAIGSALKGEMDPIEKFRVFLSADKVAAEALAMGLAKSKNEITDSAKKMATLSLILKQTKDAQGDLARTSGDADNQMKSLGGQVENLKQDLGLAFQPATEAILKLINKGFKVLTDEINNNKQAIKDWATEAGSSGGSINKTFADTGAVVSFLADSWQVLTQTFRGFRVMVTGTFAEILGGLNKANKGLEDFVKNLTGFDISTEGSDTIKIWAEEFKAKEDELLKTFQEGQKEGWASEGIDNFFNKVASGAGKAADAMSKSTEETKKNSEASAEAAAKATKLSASVSDLEKKLTLENATVGMSSTEADIYKLSLEGVDAKQLANLQTLAEQHKALEKAKADSEKMESDAKSLYDSTRTPMEEYNAKLANMDKLLKAGKISQDTFDKGKQSAGKDLREKTEPASKFSEAQEVGSQGARDTMLRFSEQAPEQMAEPTKEVAQNTKKQVDLQIEMNGLLKRMLGTTRQQLQAGGVADSDRYATPFV